ncbi:hypothetical protein HMI55_000655 [Coelomomyces lativittatus]|nr:hypothetical protein HMI55_000655 [Coelomomyces lativittatus]
MKIRGKKTVKTYGYLRIGQQSLKDRPMESGDTQPQVSHLGQRTTPTYLGRSELQPRFNPSGLTEGQPLEREIPRVSRAENQSNQYNGPRVCRYCNDAQHLRGECPKLRRHMQEGWVCLSPKGTICWADNKVDLRGSNFYQQVESFREEMSSQRSNLTNQGPVTRNVNSIQIKKSTLESSINALTIKDQDVEMKEYKDRTLNPELYSY